MKGLNRSHTDSWCRENLVQGNCRTNYCCNFENFNLIVEQSRTYPVVVIIKFLLADLVLSLRIVIEQFKRRRLEFLKIKSVIKRRRY